MEHSMEDYEDYDEYEDDDLIDDGEEEYEEVEDPKPTKEELEYLALRQRLKEKIRKQSKKDGGSHLRSNYKKLPYDNFGSFFGPSQPVISQRVIQESKSLLENQHLASRVSDHVHDNRKSPGSNSVASKPRVPPKIINEKKTKVQTLKDTRDYSFLFSEDANVPAPAKESSASVFAPSTEALSAHVLIKSKQPQGNPRQNIHVSQNVKKSVPMNGQMQSKNKSVSSGNPNLSMMKVKRPLGNSNNGNGPGRPMGNSNNGNGPGRPMGNSNNGNGPGRPMGNGSNGNGPGRPVGNGNKVNGPGRPVGNSNNGYGPGRQMVAPKAPSALMQKKPLPTSKSPVPGVHRPLPAKKLEDKRNEMRPPSKAKIAPNRPVSSSRPQMSKPPPQRQISSRPGLNDQRPKKRPARPYSDEEDDDGGEAISLIRKMFGYNPARFAGDDDDSDMEANFDDIMMEEKRSAKIARKEDEEQLRLIQEEEERERRARIKRLKRAKA
ncbi:AAC-rich mRNA clone AAC11 protein-like isoform X3 [Cucurbita moschata]|uniref:AAC-rich mRNA clone AAC11 protein-like isoform X3 n=1 Tax=Cucurbita moschata TaxID=3662 RepID=A0A6J1HIG2_CUCMO|nr:AAC-rich mRNA clone AAC11 protein-like isoform X3 [Cucurbita moschata]